MDDQQPISLILTSIELECFKAAFRPGPVALQPFTTLVGRNGSGKSTLIEALQWIDTALREDAGRASDRYFGVHDLTNLRSKAKPPYFRIKLEWSDPANPAVRLRYSIRVAEAPNGSTPVISAEELTFLRGRTKTPLIVVGDGSKTRQVWLAETARWAPFDEPERLALGRLTPAGLSPEIDRYYVALRQFWQNAVFLRLIPRRRVPP